MVVCLPSQPLRWSWIFAADRRGDFFFSPVFSWAFRNSGFLISENMDFQLSAQITTSLTVFQAGADRLDRGGRYVPPVKRKVSPAAGFSLFVLCSTASDRRRFIRRPSSRPGLGRRISAPPACAFVPSLLSALRQVCCRISAPSAARMVYL